MKTSYWIALTIAAVAAHYLFPPEQYPMLIIGFWTIGLAVYGVHMDNSLGKTTARIAELEETVRQLRREVNYIRNKPLDWQPGAAATEY